MATFTPNSEWLRAMDTAIEQVQKRSTDLEEFAQEYKAELKAAVDKLTNIQLGDVPQPAFVPAPIEPAPESGLAAPPVFPTSRVQLPGAQRCPASRQKAWHLCRLPGADSGAFAQQLQVGRACAG